MLCANHFEVTLVEQFGFTRILKPKVIGNPSNVRENPHIDGCQLKRYPRWKTLYACSGDHYILLDFLSLPVVYIVNQVNESLQQTHRTIKAC